MEPTPTEESFKIMYESTHNFYKRIMWGVFLWALISSTIIFFVLSFAHFLWVKGLIKEKWPRNNFWFIFYW